MCIQAVCWNSGALHHHFIALFHKRLHPFDRACERTEQWIKEQQREITKRKKKWGFVPLHV